MTETPYDQEKDPMILPNYAMDDLTERIIVAGRRQIYDALVHTTVTESMAALADHDPERALAVLVAAEPRYTRLKADLSTKEEA